jgi:hypothetical protein
LGLSGDHASPRRWRDGGRSRCTLSHNLLDWARQQAPSRRLPGKKLIHERASSNSRRHKPQIFNPPNAKNQTPFAARVIPASLSGLRLSDPELLQRALQLGRILFSQVEDLIVEAVRFQRSGEPFASAVFARQLDSTFWSSGNGIASRAICASRIIHASCGDVCGRAAYGDSLESW